MHRNRIRNLGFLVGGFLATTGTALAQDPDPRLHVSTTSSVQLGTDPPLDDGSVLSAGSGVDVEPHFVEGHWLATSGFVPGDIDGFARRPGTTEGSNESMAFSLLSNEAGLLDGDILSFAPGGGIDVVVSETTLVNGLGVPEASIDVDALDFDAQERLLFSLQSDLDGTVLGTVQDGDVLRLETTGVVTLFMSEQEIQAKFSAATGLSDSIGDVQAIEFWTGELWVATQSPSSHDGAVLSCASTPYVVTEEDRMGLEGAEIDALANVRAGDEIPSFTMSPASASAGDTLHVELSGSPNTRYVVLMSGGAGYHDFSQHPGFGAWYFDPLDPWLSSVLGQAPRVTLDSSGKFETDWQVPTAMVHGTGFGGEEGWSFQVMELPSKRLSAPFRVARL